MSQTALTYRTNRDLFSNYYLDEHLPETEAWNEPSDEELRDARARLRELWDRERETAPKRNESQLEANFIRPMFRRLGIPFEVEESTSRTQRRPDYGFFPSEEATREAFDRREAGGDFYADCVAVADAKRWGRPLDTRGGSEHERDFENPSYQIHVYLQETPADWAVLTDGRKWRLYHGPTSHRLDSYYEIDLPTVLESDDLDAFRYFYLFFRHEAFLEDGGGDCFLDEVYEESNVFAEELGEDLQDNIYEAIRVLSAGFLAGNDDLSEADLDRIHDSSLIYLYRLIFVLYAESEGRDLLPTDNRIYREQYSLNELKQTVATNRDDGQDHYLAWQTDLHDRVGELFDLINQGSGSRGIPEADLYIPAYNGGLFRTDPEADDSVEARFLATHEVGDSYLAEVIDLLTRRESDRGDGQVFVDYSSLDVRHLGSIYEGLLEYELHVADEPLALADGEYVPAEDGDPVTVDAGEVYLTTDSGERKATGSYYTPEYVVEYIVEETLGPLVAEIREDLAGQSGFDDGGFAGEFADRVFELKVLDPAMGSGHFLTSAIDYLAREIIDAQERQADQEGVESIDRSHDINWARRQVAQRCIYGVDLNPLAVELAKVSLWLRTLAAEQPLAFLDHHLKTGNSLVGSDIEDVLSNGEDGLEEGQLTLQQSFARTRQEALEHVMDRFQDLLAVDNESLADIKEMEAAFEAVRDDPLYQRLLAMANVHTAEAFGLDVPGDAYERMAEALRDDSWTAIEEQDWFRSAQAMAEEERFFHWELEFPVAFYDDDGRRQAQSGFDAVIGNPPWAISRDERLNSYVTQTYSLQSGKPDLYRIFLERCISFSRAKFAMVTPNTWLTIPSAESLRAEFVDSRALQAGTLIPADAFDEVEANMVTFDMDFRGDADEISVFDLSEEGVENLYSLEYQNISSDSYKIDLQVDGEVLKLARQISDQSARLGEVSESTTGYQLYHNTIHTESEIENQVYHADSRLDDSYVPEIRGGSINRYFVDQEPAGYVDLSADFYRLPDARFRQGDKVLIREITSERGIVSSFVREEVLYPKSIIGLRSDELPEGFLTTVINSKVAYFSFLALGEKSTQELFPRISKSDLSSIPVPSNPYEEIDAETVQEYDIEVTSRQSAEVLSELEEKIRDAHTQRSKLNLNLMDYLGEYTDGKALADVGLFHPSDSNILDLTTEGRDSLRIGDVRVIEHDSGLSVEATARYKPEDMSQFETDQHGYTETDYHEAFTLTDLTEEEAALIEAFVPVAVEKGDGFAGFRDNATKTISPLDRLKTITLPDPDDVAHDLRRYLEVRERAEELDEQIERTDRLIDEIVYDLYDLTDEEIAIVEDAVGDD